MKSLIRLLLTWQTRSTWSSKWSFHGQSRRLALNAFLCRRSVLLRPPWALMRLDHSQESAWCTPKSCIKDLSISSKSPIISPVPILRVLLGDKHWVVKVKTNPSEQLLSSCNPEVTSPRSGSKRRKRLPITISPNPSSTARVWAGRLNHATWFHISGYRSSSAIQSGLSVL